MRSFFVETVIRIKDPLKSLHFYKDLLGLSLLKKKEDVDARLTHYQLGYLNTVVDKNSVKSRDGTLVLQHHWDAETLQDLVYQNGNTDPFRGFGHTCIAVDNLDAACDRLDRLGAIFKKKPSDGRQKDIAFVLDPDNYWIELINNRTIENNVETSNPSNYVFNHTMIRVKDPKISLEFYKDLLGLELARVTEFESAKFNLYFLAFNDGNQINKDDLDPKFANPQSGREGILELTWNYGTESDKDFAGYSNGNEKDGKGFSNITFSVPDIKATKTSLDQKGLSKFGKIVDETEEYNSLYVLDPDGYQLKIISQN